MDNKQFGRVPLVDAATAAAAVAASACDETRRRQSDLKLSQPRTSLQTATPATRQDHQENGRPKQHENIELVAKRSATSTRWLSAIIVVLIGIIVLLLLVDLRAIYSLRDAQQRNRLAAQAAAAAAASSRQERLAAEQGKLQAASSDSHYLSADSFEPTGAADDDQDDQHSDDQTTPGGGGELEGGAGDDQLDVAAPERNQVRPAHRKRPPAAHKAARRDPDAICMTSGCVRAAAQLLNNMDNRTKPCDDFYQFACGRWIDTQLIPDEKSSLSVFSQNTADLNVKLRALIERQQEPASAPPIVRQMRNLYASCMNLSEIEQRGDEPLLEAIRFFGGWPVLAATGAAPLGDRIGARPLLPASGQRQRRRSRAQRQADEQTTSFDWLETIIKFRRRGFSHDIIIDLSIVPDVRQSRRYIIELDQPTLGLPDRSYYFKGLNDSTVGAYYNLMVESAVLLGAARQEARRQMFEALEFETSLAKISIAREQRRNVTRLYNKMPLAELYKLAPNIDWQKYMAELLGDKQLDFQRDEVIVKVPSFLQALDELLLQVEPRVLANYMVWRVVRHSMANLSRKWRELAHTYSAVTTGRQAEEPRWEQCLGSLEGTLGTALSALYVRNHFNEHSKAAALEMVDYIRREFLQILNEVDWMDEETREEAKLKAKAIAAYIGYPDELLRNELVEELYEGVELRRSNFYENVRALRIWSTNYAFGQLRKPNKRGDWRKHAKAAVVNAFYNSLENSIEFPAGILQGAFFDAERPNYMNFGAIGYVIGHEITHGFDDRGRQFDRDGNERNWWKPKTDARYRERAQCIVEQYGNFSVSLGPAEQPLRVNGLNTQGENIADNGGIKEAFRAYRRWTKDNGREPRLPGLDYSPDQLFWISAANIWCGKFRPEVLKLRINSGVHSPARFRIIGPLSNSAEFAQSFKCPPGSPMNPHKKCAVW